MTNRTEAARKANATRKANREARLGKLQEINEAWNERLSEEAHNKIADIIADIKSDYESAVAPVLEEANGELIQRLRTLRKEIGDGFVLEAVQQEWMEHWEGLYDTLEEAMTEVFDYENLDVDEAYTDLEKDIEYVNCDFLKPDPRFEKQVETPAEVAEVTN